MTPALAALKRKVTKYALGLERLHRLAVKSGASAGERFEPARNALGAALAFAAKAHRAMAEAVAFAELPTVELGPRSSAEIDDRRRRRAHGVARKRDQRNRVARVRG